jgi:hypothetical protein
MSAMSDFVVDVGLVEHGDTGTRLDGRDYPSKNFDLSIAVQPKGVPLRGINAGDVVQRQAAHRDIGGRYVGVLGAGDNRANGHAARDLRRECVVGIFVRVDQRQGPSFEGTQIPIS